MAELEGMGREATEQVALPTIFEVFIFFEVSDFFYILSEPPPPKGGYFSTNFLQNICQGLGAWT